jgi:hypothetical protein
MAVVIPTIINTLRSLILSLVSMVFNSVINAFQNQAVSMVKLLDDIFVDL